MCHFTFKNTPGKKVTLVGYVFVLTSVNVFDSDSRRRWVFGSGAVWELSGSVVGSRRGSENEPKEGASLGR